MNITYVLIAAAVLLMLVVVVALAVKAKVRSGGNEDGGSSEAKAMPDAYDLRRSLFTPAERSFVGVLETLDLEGVTIASKVRLADIFTVKKGLERGDRRGAQNRIDR